MLLEIIKQMRALIREQKEEEKYRAQLMKMPLNFEALDYLANKYKDRKITVQVEGNAVITIEPKDVNETKYKSFSDRYKEAHQQR